MAHRTINFLNRISFMKLHNSSSSGVLLAVYMPPNIDIYENFQAGFYLFSWDLVSEEDGSFDSVKSCSLSFVPSEIIFNFCWSDETNLKSFPKLLKFYAVDECNVIWVYTFDTKRKSDRNIVGHHSSFINALVEQPESGLYLASVGDDNRCCLWTANEKNIKDNVVFHLTSPGINVLWNPKEPNKFMVAEKNGMIRFYSAESKKALFSLDSCQNLLSTSDWSSFNSLYVAAMVESDLTVFDTSKSNRPMLVEKVTDSGAVRLAWCPSVDYILTFVSRSKYQLTVLNVKSMKILFTMDLKLYRGFEWHTYLPHLYVADDMNIHIIDISSKI
ncbi:hypothetical protein HELRODRAFT_168949 [Helobdella robusta]|uniref:Nucleoporin Nup37 n=1 Tax=Helobdella robusta TaxID=6412 RepID=T1F165_HELRO|nr:hypothetical protein HELRODRAFT_168949 [Helobdella robusta]ESO09017.1 hypothetical protein HELRODRAFT_168949 [Helobdella robusta]